MKKAYEGFCKAEEIITMILLAGIMVLVFVAAMARTVGHPINWAQDAALIAFAWMIFLGSDMAVRTTGLIGIDVIMKRLPYKVGKALDILFKIIIIGFLAVLVWYGFVMVQTGYQRQINTLHVSYAWVTASVPVGAFLMIISTLIKIVEETKEMMHGKIKEVTN